MKKQKYNLFLFIIFSLALVGIVSACSDIGYDSGLLCLDSGYNASMGNNGLSDYVILLDGNAHHTSSPEGICGYKGDYYLYTSDSQGIGIIEFKTQSLSKAGEYILEIYFKRGSANQSDEDFAIQCGSKTYEFPDANELTEEYRKKAVTCSFNSGKNEVRLISRGKDSVHFERFKIYNCAEPECTSDSDCKQDYNSSKYCKNNNVYYDFHDFFCDNGKHAENIVSKLFEECGADSCNSWEANYCKNNDVYHKRTCYDKGCANNSCFSNSNIEELKVETCSGGCWDGRCLQTPQCTKDSECGDDYYSDKYCKSDDVYKDFHDFSCKNQKCNEEIKKELVEECNACSNGKCVEGDDKDNRRCIEKWECGLWSECKNNFQFRECTDLRKCHTEKNKPEDERECKSKLTSLNIQEQEEEAIRLDSLLSSEQKTLTLGDRIKNKINNALIGNDNKTLALLIIFALLVLVFIILLIAVIVR